MSRQVIVGLVLFGAFVVYAQTPIQFDAHAKAVAAQSPLVHQSVHSLRGGSQWARYQLSVSNLKWDVKKTDSLLTPVLAIVSADAAYSSTAPQATRDEAQAAELRPPKDLDKLEMTYVPTDTGWKWSSGRIFLQALNRWSPITADDGGMPKDQQLRWLAEVFVLPVK